MKREIAEQLVDMNWDLEVMPDYSGRGMYGKTTFAVAGPQEAILKAIAEVCLGADADEFDPADFAFRSDSLGYSTVWY